jgi:O-succinylbenzoic acid--CoA ligase
MRGYLNDTEANARALRSGWLHTGDIGLVDAAGRRHLLDRRSDLIVSGGENVYPSEIEAVLLRHPGLRDAAVVGETDPEWGQRVVAHVVLEADSSRDESDLEAHCRAQLAGFKVPRRFYFRDQLPRSAGGKLLRRELRPQQGPR